MKIAFVNDSCERLGIAYISAVLKANGHEVRLFTDPQLFDDENIRFGVLSRLFDYRGNIISRLKEYRPDLIGISVVTDFYQWACAMAKEIKRNMQVPIIFGGIHPSSVPERVIKNDFVDMVCVGEGEYPILELANSMQKGKIDYSIKNIWFKNNGSIIKNKVRPLIGDLDVLPFADKDIFHEASPHFLQCYYIMASRGCPNACSYCCHSYLRKLYDAKEKYLRFRTVENVIQELVLAKKKFDIKIVRFHDDDLMAASSKWLKKFSEFYVEKVRVPFTCFVHPATVTEEKAKCLAFAGCHDVEIGIQSVSEKTRREIMNRNISNPDLEKAIFILKDSGLKIITDNIVGVPGQSEDETIDMLKFYNRNRVMKTYCFGFRYYPKTEIIQQAQHKGLLEKKDIEALEEGRDVEAFIRGGDSLTTQMKQIQTYFSLLLYFPYNLNSFIISNKLYRFFPPLPYFITVIFSNWLRIPYRYNWALHITITRYRHFIFKKTRHFFSSLKIQDIMRRRGTKKIRSISLE